jgi:hypothetical protein
MGTVFGKKVGLDEFNNQWRAALQRARQVEAWGGKITLEQVEAWTWDRIVKLHEAKRWGVVIPMSIVRERIVDLFSVQGEFDEPSYRSYLQRLGMSEREFAALLRDDMRIEWLERLVTETVVVTPQELREQYDYDKEERKITFHLVETDSLLPAFETSADGEQYYRAHRDEFQEPRKVALQYVIVEKESFLNEVSVTDEEIKNYYDENRETYKGADGETVDLEEVRPQIERLLKNRKVDEMARRQADDLLGFSDAFSMREVAQKNGLTFRETGLIPEEGSLGSGDFSQEEAFREAAFNTPLGALSSIIKTNVGYCVLSPVRAVPSRIPPFEEVREAAAEKERAQRLEQVASRLGVPPERIETFVTEHSPVPAGTGVTYEDVRQYYDSPTRKSEFMKQKKVKVQYLTLEKEPFQEEVKIRDRDIRAEYRENEEKYKDESGKVKPLEEVRGEIESDLRSAKADEAARKRAEEIFAIYRPQRMRERAIKYGLELRESRLFSQGEMIDDYMGTSSSFASQAFQTELGEVSDIFSVEKGYCVLSPIQFVDEAVADFEDVVEDVVQKAKTEKAENLAVQLATDLQRQVRDKMTREKKEFQAACKELGLKLEESDYFGRDDYSIGKIGSTRGYTRTIFQTEPGQLGATKKVPRGAFFYAITDVKVPSDEEFAEEKDTYYRRLSNEKMQQSRQEWSVALMRQANVRKRFPITRKTPPE